MRRWPIIAIVLLALAGGCTKERVADARNGGGGGAGTDYTCLTCHADVDSIKNNLTPAALQLAAIDALAPRGDG